MPTIIDSLVLEIGLDPKLFDKKRGDVLSGFKGLREEGERTAKSMDASGKQAQSFFKGLTREALTFGTVLFGGVGLATFFKDVMNSNAAIGRFSANIGTSTEKLSAWESVARGVGGTAQDVASSLGALSGAYQNYLLGRMPSADFIQALNLLNRETGSNISLGDMADPTVAAMKLADAAQHLSRPRAHTILGMLGQTEAMINLELQGPTKLAAQLRDAVHLTNEQADAAAAAQVQLAKTTQKFRDLANELETDALPTLDRFVDGLGGVFGWLKQQNDQMASDWDKSLKSHVRNEDDRDMDQIWNQTLGGWLGYRGGGSAQNPRGYPVGTPGWWSGQPNGSAPAPAGGGFGSTLSGTGAPGAIGDVSGAIAQAYAMQRAAGGGGGGATGGSSEQAVQAALMSAGFSAAQAKGMAAWVFTESGFDPTSFNSAGGGHGALGIGQWRGVRQARLKAMFGSNPTLAQQIQFMAWELAHSESGAASAIRRAGTPEQALWATITRFGRGSRRDNLSDLHRGLRHLGGGSAVAAAGNHSSEVHIGRIDVHGVDTNKAEGVAAGLKPALGRFGLATQANQGVF